MFEAACDQHSMKSSKQGKKQRKKARGTGAEEHCCDKLCVCRESKNIFPDRENIYAPGDDNTEVARAEEQPLWMIKKVFEHCNFYFLVLCVITRRSLQMTPYGPVLTDPEEETLWASTHRLVMTSRVQPSKTHSVIVSSKLESVITSIAFSAGSCF